MGGAEKHEIYAATFGDRLFMTNFYRVGGGGNRDPPLDPLLAQTEIKIHDHDHVVA